VYVHDPKDQLRLGMPVTVTVDRTASEASSRQGGATMSNTSAPAET
jgi:hypothetical protein